MKRRLIGVLAVYGAVTLVMQMATLVLDRTVNRRIAGIVLRGEDQRLVNVPVFLDDGTGPRTARTDSAGAFRFDIEPDRLARARLLICAPGAQPMYSEQQSLNNLTPTRYFIGALEPNRRVVDDVRGWRASLPAECGGRADRAD